MDIFKLKRRNLLLLLDEGIKVNDIDLGMYDLTPYYSESSEETLVEKILKIKNDIRQVQHIKDKKICFAPPQEEALKFLENKKRCILSAPTSFGKTLIVKEYIYLLRPQSIVYIVPTNALAYELENSFKDNSCFSDYSIFDRKKIEVTEIAKDEQLLFIGTQEKYLEIKDSLPQNIDLFIIDEAYKLKESTKMQRGYKLSESFLDSITRKSQKIFLLSPNAEFEGFDKFEFDKFESSYNPVDKVFSMVEVDDFYNVLHDKATREKTILYCDSPAIINDTVDKLSSCFEDFEVNQFVNFLESEYHPDWSVVKLLKKGILVHHGQMPKYIQNKMINLFNNSKKYLLLIGTNSISEGINTPTKYLFVHPDCTRIQSDRLLLKNTIGRAGRLGEYPIGHIYSTDNIDKIVNETIQISLSISKDEELEELKNNSSEEIIEALCSDYGIEKDFYYELRQSTHLSISTIIKIFNVLKENIRYPNFDNLPFMAQKVFNEYTNAYIDKICIKGIMQYSYNDLNGTRTSLSTFEDRIDFYRVKSKVNLSNSTIIDNYMRFMYSSLEYYIYPIAKIAKKIYETYPEWKFGKNVLECIEMFIERYNRKIIGLTNYDQYSEEQKIILQALKDYGIIINNNVINLDMIIEIENNLNIRYSTYDIINSIKFLAENSKENKVKFTYLKTRYID